MTEKAAPYGDPRPHWVQLAIGDLGFAAEHLEAAQRLMDKVAAALTTNALPDATSSLLHGRHDAEHAWQHVASTRRAVRMAWPREPGDEKEIAP